MHEQLTPNPERMTLTLSECLYLFELTLRPAPRESTPEEQVHYSDKDCEELFKQDQLNN